MGTTRTAWHVLLAALLSQRAPRRFEVRSEVPLSAEPLRTDYLLLRRTSGPDDAGTLRKLWRLLPKDTIVEFKSVARPYRGGNLDRLWSYLHLYYADELARMQNQRSNLCGLLLVASRTRTLDADVATLGLAWGDLGGGYWQLQGGAFTLYLAEIDVVAEVEDDDLLRLFGHGEAHTVEARRWLSQQLGAEEVAMAMHELEGFDEVLRKLVATLPPEQVLAAYAPEQVLSAYAPEQRLAGLAPEQVLAAYAPEQRVAGLAPEQRLLLLADEALRALSDAYLDTLPADTRAAIRARIGR